MLLLLVSLSVRQQFHMPGAPRGGQLLGPLVGGPLVQFVSHDHLEGYIRSIKSKAHTEAFVRLLTIKLEFSVGVSPDPLINYCNINMRALSVDTLLSGTIVMVGMWKYQEPTSATLWCKGHGPEHPHLHNNPLLYCGC